MARGVPVHRMASLPTGFVVLGMSGFMLFCAAIGQLYSTFGFHRNGTDDWSGLEMVVSAAITGGIGAFLLWWGQPAKGIQMRRTEATITTTFVWVMTGMLGALPFVIDTHMPYPDAVFEAVSGFTTTGATVVVDIERGLSRPVLLWRSLMQWLGGMGIVVLFIAIFPNLGVSGKHMFRTEVPGHSAEGLKPKITETSIVLWRLYALFTAVEVAVLMALFTWFVPKTTGNHWAENLFDAVCHAFTTLSTGGFSTRNASVGYYDSPLLDVTLSFFMLLAGVNFGLFYGAMIVRRRRDLRGGSLKRTWWMLSDASTVFRRSVEFRVYLSLVFLATAMLTVAILPNHGNDWGQALRYALFMVSTTVTSTGYGTDDYMAYQPTGLGIVLLLMFIGGMSGSTAGGIKVSRVILLAESTWAQLHKSIRPAVVQITRLGREVISEDTLHAVSTFFFIYMASLGLGSLIICYTDGVSPQTAFGAMLTSLSNMGPGPYYEGSDNFAAYSPTAKMLFSFAMILGRLEFFTVLALLLPDAWKH